MNGLFVLFFLLGMLCGFFAFPLIILGISFWLQIGGKGEEIEEWSPSNKRMKED